MTPTAPMRRILVVDDDPDIRQLAGRILARAGYEVRAAENGLRAMALLDGGGYDAVVTDIVMPDMDGIEFLKAMPAAGAGDDGRRPGQFRHLPALRRTLRRQPHAGEALHPGRTARGREGRSFACRRQGQFGGIRGKTLIPKDMSP
jgi:CheY-like chemotaxis protein